MKAAEDAPHRPGHAERVDTPSPTDDRPLSGRRVGIFGKGGSGKSTLTVMLAGALRSSGYSVLVVDADSTNLGLAAALGMDRDPTPLLEYFGGTIFSGGRVTCPVDDPVPLAGAEIAVTALPGHYVARNADGVRLVVAGKLGALGPGAGCDGPIAKITRDLRVTGLGPAAVTLVDHKAGFEDTARGVLVGLDWVLAVVDPTAAAVAMATNLARTVDEIRAGVPPAVRHLERPELAELAVRLYRESRVLGTGAVLNRVASASTEDYLREALRRAGVPVLGCLGEEPGIQEQWLRGERLVSPRLLEAARLVGRGLEQAVGRARETVAAPAGR